MIRAYWIVVDDTGIREVREAFGRPTHTPSGEPAALVVGPYTLRAGAVQDARHLTGIQLRALAVPPVAS